MSLLIAVEVADAVTAGVQTLGRPVWSSASPAASKKVCVRNVGIVERTGGERSAYHVLWG